MKFQIMHDRSFIDGTSLKGYVRIRYRDLVSLFGKPVKGDGFKTRAEWVLLFEDGTVGTIYDWACSGPKAQNSDWHVGGTTGCSKVFGRVMEACAGHAISARAEA